MSGWVEILELRDCEVLFDNSILRLDTFVGSGLCWTHSWADKQLVTQHSAEKYFKTYKIYLQ